MEVRHFILSEYFGVEDDGKFTFAGVFDQIFAKEFPVTLGMGILTVVLNTVIGEDTEGEFVDIRLRVDGNPGTVSMVKAPVPSVPPDQEGLPPGSPITLFIRIGVRGVSIPEPGCYYFDAIWKEEVKQTVRLRAFQAPAEAINE